MKYQAIFFDLDGTLIDTAADFVVTLERLCANHGIAPPSSESIRSTVSDGARALVKLAFSLQDNNEKIEIYRQELLDIYEQELGKNAPLFNEIEPLLQSIKQHDMPWGIVTNKPRKYTELLLERIGLNVPFVICPCDVKNAKPDPESLFLIAKLANVDAEKCLYFGDHERDIVAGRAATMDTAACAWGYIAKQDTILEWEADYNCYNAAEASAAAGF